MKIKEYALTGLVIFLMFALLFSYSTIRNAEKEAQDCKTKYLNREIEISEEKRELQSQILIKKQQTYVNKKIRATIPVNDKLEFLRQHAIPTNIGAK